MTYPGTKPRVPSAIESSLITRIVQLEEERTWIPVSERLPERDAEGCVQAVLVILEGFENEVEFGELRPQGWALIGADDILDPIRVTHWMPLPKPPRSSAGS